MTNENYTNQSDQQRQQQGQDRNYAPQPAISFGLTREQQREIAKLWDWAKESLEFDIDLSKPLSEQI